MSAIVYIFNEFFYRPLFNILIFLYDTVSFGDLGAAIIVMTVFIRLALLPLFYKSAKDQAILRQLAPKIKEIQENHKHDKEKQARAMFELYREHKVNPFSGFLLILIQIPVLIALYSVFRSGITDEILNDYLYSFIARPAAVPNDFLGVVDLGGRSFIIAVLAAVAQYFQGKLSIPKIDKGGEKNLAMAEAINRQMAFIAPFLTFSFLYFSNLPAAVGLYWLTTGIFSVIQQIALNKRLSASHEVERELKEEEKKIEKSAARR